MRDINRIEPLLEKLGHAWKKNPDQRFGQFLVNFFGESRHDVWNTEDDEWMVAIQAFIDGKDPGKAIDEYFDQKYSEAKHGWWECPCCGIKYREQVGAQFDKCPNCGLELTED